MQNKLMGHLIQGATEVQQYWNAPGALGGEMFHVCTGETMDQTAVLKACERKQGQASEKHSAKLIHNFMQINLLNQEVTSKGS